MVGGMCDPKGARGMFFPAFEPYEREWGPWRIIIYAVGLGWFFLGVSIIADIFMMAIEAITSQKVQVKDKATGKARTIKVWNATVANLTLMALGSSAPEILLNVLELFSGNFKAGALGPGTIVGSAAFNLLGITAVCVVAIPSPDVRKIQDIWVYGITASFSVFAYLWLVIILVLISPDLVEMWEGLFTFFMFPILIVLAFLADKGIIGGSKAVANSRGVLAAELAPEELASLIMEVKKEFGDKPDDEIMQIVERKTAARPSKAAYRYMSNKTIVSKKQAESASKLFHMGTRVGSMGELKAEVKKPPAVIQFVSPVHTTRESVGMLPLRVQRLDDMASTVKVRYRTVDGSAKAKSKENPDGDFEALDDWLTFEPNEEFKDVSIKILDDDEWEGHEKFTVELLEPKPEGSCVVGTNRETEIQIIDDDDPGILAFAEEQLEVTEKDSDFTLQVQVKRLNGSKGTIGCRYYTENESAVAPHDYEALDNKLELTTGEGAYSIPVIIKARGRYDSSKEVFRLLLAEPTENTSFNAETDGGKDQCICTITIKENSETKQKTDMMAKTLAINWDKARIGTSNWKDQFTQAIYVGGDAESQKEAGVADWFMHVTSFPFKIVFALCPPPDFCNGWPCFCVALFFIGLVTACISDLANLLGCSIYFPTELTAITLVAIGTSLPDTLASMTAARQDEYADASIGNVTGSNSVNVFLGLGMPWSIGCIYWHIENDVSVSEKFITDRYETGFIVKAGSLGLSVVAYVACACAAIACLAVRRVVCGAELGGPYGPKVFSGCFLFSLWLTYIGISVVIMMSS